MVEKTAISPTRLEDFPQWYQQVVRHADLAESSAVRGCMVIKPWGYAIWENMQKILDEKIKSTGHKNAYFPLFVPLSFLEKEAEHVDGFAKECAVVTHHRLEQGIDGKLMPGSPLEEPLIIRPTSEAIIGVSFAKWVRSYRDLPLLINQWANIVRWEMRPRIFLRTTEFLWQEGHTVHATKEEAIEEALKMLKVYSEFANEYLAMPTIIGQKTASEQFPGAEATYCLEAMMQDRKALQAGTTHFMGQNFSKVFDIKFCDINGNLVFGWTTSWGVSTRLIGGMIMTHSDDNGFVAPPRVAPMHIVILPIIHNDNVRNEVLTYCHNLAVELRKIKYIGRNIEVDVDDRDIRGGEKIWLWIKKGVPIRLEIGPRDIVNDSVSVGRRDRSHKEKRNQKKSEFIDSVISQLEDIQNQLFIRASEFQKKHICRIDSKQDFYDFFTPKNSKKPEIHGGFALTHWNGDPEVEKQIKEDLNVTIRSIPFEDNEGGICPFSKQNSIKRVIFAKSY